MSRDVASDIQGPWTTSHDIARASKACRAMSPATFWAPLAKVATSLEMSRNVTRAPNPCRATSPETSPEHLGDVATGRHPCRETSPETFRATPPLTLGLFAKLLNEFVLGGAISY